jgi:hypothetical protein
MGAAHPRLPPARWLRHPLPTSPRPWPSPRRVRSGGLAGRPVPLAPAGSLTGNPAQRHPRPPGRTPYPPGRRASSAHKTPWDRARILKRADAPEHGCPGTTSEHGSPRTKYVGARHPLSGYLCLFRPLGPARSMTTTQHPDSGKPGAHQGVHETRVSSGRPGAGHQPPEKGGGRGPITPTRLLMPARRRSCPPNCPRGPADLPSRWPQNHLTPALWHRSRSSRTFDLFPPLEYLERRSPVRFRKTLLTLEPPYGIEP